MLSAHSVSLLLGMYVDIMTAGPSPVLTAAAMMQPGTIVHIQRGSPNLCRGHSMAVPYGY